jgi:DNA-binding transcriptional LysR family regulator
VRSHIASGALVRVQEDWCPYYPGFYLYYPSRRQMPSALRAFIDFARTK